MFFDDVETNADGTYKFDTNLTFHLEEWLSYRIVEAAEAPAPMTPKREETTPMTPPKRKETTPMTPPKRKAAEAPASPKLEETTPKRTAVKLFEEQRPTVRVICAGNAICVPLPQKKKARNTNGQFSHAPR